NARVVLRIGDGVAALANAPQLDDEVVARHDGPRSFAGEGVFIEVAVEILTREVSEQHLTQRCGVGGEFAPDVTLIARTRADQPLPRAFRWLDAIHQKDVAGFEHTNTRGEAGLTGHAIKHRFSAGAEAELAQGSVRERDRLEPDLVAAGVFVAHQVTLALETRENPRATAARDFQAAADFGITQAAGSFFDDVEQEQGAFERVSRRGGHARVTTNIRAA